ncbi:MAG: hypothetical protein M1837_002274 [Sclerophora amabilis]|nr:MAG: hypothetical protein M1837_002274 [Sclerophora amabilis]
MHEALVNNKVITKRDIFYMDKDLFERQSIVNGYVDDIACTFGVKRRCLNVVCLKMLFLELWLRQTRILTSLIARSPQRRAL